MTSSSPAAPPTLLTFQLTDPPIALELSLGRRAHSWHLVFGRAYGFVDSREIARLDLPAPPAPSVQHARHPTFWLDPRATSGWETPGRTLLDLLLSAEPRVLRRTGGTTRAGCGDTEGAGEAVEVEVLVPEERLSHWCAGHAEWEAVTNDEARWVAAGQEYLCSTVRSRASFVWTIGCLFCSVEGSVMRRSGLGGG